MGDSKWGEWVFPGVDVLDSQAGRLCPFRRWLFKG